MADIENVIKGLEQCTKSNYCQGSRCPYFEEKTCDVIKKDALELLKEYQEKIETARKWLKEDSVDIEFIAKRFVI